MPFNTDTRVRFAPSPSGFLHVGGARTALYNWLIARQCGGRFILRIEDTDRERSTDESIRAVLDALRWLGLDWDEGPHLQSERADAHRRAVERMVEAGRAYPCFCTTERLDELRQAAQDEGRTVVYDGACRALAPDDVARRIEAGQPHTIRFHVEPGRVVEFDDLVGGPRRMETDRLGDFVVQRSDGSPVFHLGVVVDDHDMGVTHIIRGDDHLANTPRQILLFEALGWDAPVYGHLPMIQGPDRARLSKRHGATNVLAFRDEGYLPETMVNFLALLGWSFDDSTELMTREELIERFSVERIGRSASIFDRDKLAWMNGAVMRALGAETVAQRAREFFLNDGVEPERLEDPWFTSVVALELERARTLREMREKLDYLLCDTIEEYEPKGARKHLLREGADERLAQIETALAEADPFDKATTEAALRGLVEREGAKLGAYAQPLRMALTGRMQSPGLFDVLEALGRDRSLARIHAAREWISEGTKA